MGEQSSTEVLEGLLDPIIILDRQRNIRFMNGVARRLLGEGLHLRLAAHVRSTPGIGPISQVHFKLQNGHDLILKVKIGEIEWLGEKATQVTVSNVTAYLAMIQELQKELAARKQAPAEALAAPGDAEAKLQAELADESAARAQAQEDARTLQENLDLVTQENTRLQSDLARAARERDESKSAPAAELEQARSELKLQTDKAAEAAQALETERAGFVSSAAALAASLEQARQEAQAEAAQRRKAEAALKEADAAAAASEQLHSNLRQQFEALLQDNKRLTQDLAERAPRESEWAAARDALEAKAAALAGQVQALQSELSAATAERDGLESRAGALGVSLEQARQQGQAEAAQRTQAQAALEKARAAASAAEQAHARLQQESEALRRDMGQLTAGADEKASQAAELREENARLARELAERAPRESEWAAARDALEAKVEALAKQVQALQSELSAATAERDGLVSRADALDASLEQARQQAQSEAAQAQAALEKARAATAERDGLVSRAGALDASLEQARQQAQSETAQAQAALEKARAAASAAEQAHARLQQESEALRRDMGQLTAGADEKASQAAELREENARLARELAERAPRESELAAARDALEAKVEALARDLAAARQETARAPRESEWAAARDALEAKAAALARDLAAARQETARAIGELLARKVESGGPGEKLTAQAEALQSELSAAAAEREKLQRTIASLRQDLAHAQQARSEWAETWERLNNEARDHADALAQAREEAAQAARSAEAEGAKAAEAEERAVSAAQELERVRGELSRSMDEAQVSQKAWAQERAELQRGADDGPEQEAVMGDPHSEETLGSYRLTECRAEGHIARICKGLDRATGQKVLIRIVDPMVCRNERIRAVLEELRDPASPRRVPDPHILKILDVGVRRDSYYIVHEDFGGVPLDEYVKETRPSLKESLGLARAMAECLRAVHGFRLVHGDLKPQNILVGRDAAGKPIVKVALADLAHDAADAMLSVYGELVGTPKYLSPEQIQGKPATAGSDLFSLGVILYELFSGREPFPAESPLGYLHANVATDLLPLAGADTAIPSDLGAVVGRLLERQPRNRYRTAQALLDDLDRVEARLGGAAPEPVPPGADSAFAPVPPEAASPPARGPRVILLTAAVTAASLLLVTVLVLGIVFQFQHRPARPSPAVPVAIEAPPPPPKAPAAPVVPEAEKAFTDTMKQVKTLADAGKFDEAIRRLKDLRERFRDDPVVQRIDVEIAGAMLLKGADLAANAKPAEALEVYRSILRDYPTTDSAMRAGRRVPDMILAMAKALENQADLEQAMGMYESLMKEYPSSPAAADAAEILPGLRLRLAEALENSQPERAIAFLRQILASNLSEADAAKGRGLLARALFARAESRAKAGHFRDALADCQEAERLDPSLKRAIDLNEPEVLARAAIEAKDQMEFAEAVALWKQLGEKYPGAHVMQEYGDPMAALLEAANPPGAAGPADEPAILWALAQKELNANNAAAAQAYLDRLLSKYPDSAPAATARGLMAKEAYDVAVQQGRSGDVKSEQATLEKIAAADPDAAKELARIKAAPAEMVYVPGGEFIMGLSKERVAQIVAQFKLPPVMTDTWFGMSEPEERVLLNPFCIDVHPVTNAQYKKFVDATNHAPPPSPDWTEKAVKPGCQSKPVTDVDWADATAYAKWAGKRLPREAEWEKAARGIDGRLFPWGNDWDPNLCGASESDTADTAVVNLNPGGLSPYGASDMAGNVQEWTADPLKPYPAADAEGLLFKEGQQAVRGATHQEPIFILRMVTRRAGLLPGQRAATLGFRCAQDAP